MDSLQSLDCSSQEVSNKTIIQEDSFSSSGWSWYHKKRGGRFTLEERVLGGLMKENVRDDLFLIHLNSVSIVKRATTKGGKSGETIWEYS
ncbi:hypothetical protein P8452_60035 [Trifolium repens]|nr:hypothetical protein P8452_60035 [Trifolium repens]